MKELRPNVRLVKICRLFGITRQAYYQHINYRMDVEISHELVIKEVLALRKLHPRMGTRKLYIKLYLLINKQTKFHFKSIPLTSTRNGDFFRS